MRSHHLILAFFLCVTTSFSQVAFHDLFTRPNSTNLGPDWIEVNGNISVQNNALQGDGGFDLSWGHHTVFSANYANTVARCNWSMNGLGLDAVSLIIGLTPATWGGIEVRLADNNNDGLADRLFFNAAVNAGNWYGGSFFQNLTTPLISGTMLVWISNGGNTVNVTIGNPANGMTQTYVANGINLGPPTGLFVGAGLRGDARMDDFRAWVGPPTGPAYSTSVIRTTSAFELIISGAAAFAPVLIGISTTGTGPIPTGIGTIFLSDPIILLGPISADAVGGLLLPFPALGAGAFGITLHTQAVDLATPALTNPFSVTVL